MQIAEIMIKINDCSTFKSVSNIKEVQIPPVGEAHFVPFLPLPFVCMLVITIVGEIFFFFFINLSAKS